MTNTDKLIVAVALMSKHAAKVETKVVPKQTPKPKAPTNKSTSMANITDKTLVKKLDKPSFDFRIKTPSGVAGSRG